jgi:DNA-binding transcriptional ArsR family regulator
LGNVPDTFEKQMNNHEHFDELAHLFKVLAHPTRLCILSCLKDKEYCVHDIESIANCRQANISQHLSLLRANGLVQTKKVGKKVYYSVAKKNLPLLSLFSAH